MSQPRTNALSRLWIRSTSFEAVSDKLAYRTRQICGACPGAAARRAVNQVIYDTIDGLVYHRINTKTATGTTMMREAINATAHAAMRTAVSSVIGSLQL